MFTTDVRIRGRYEYTKTYQSTEIHIDQKKRVKKKEIHTFDIDGFDLYFGRIRIFYEEYRIQR